MEIFIDNLLVRAHLIIEMSRPALRHGSLNSPFQTSLYIMILLRHSLGGGAYIAAELVEIKVSR